ncbi:MAG: hypothetical protein KJ062_02415 [Thermoanaerobaculia bacterium]|nr:hypothetical protein [Thermoanaerobaculia bacterium]
MRNVVRSLAVLAIVLLAAGTANAQNVLVYDDNSNDAVAATACTNLGYACTVAGSGDFLTQLTGGSWALVVMDYPSNHPSGDWQTALAAYVTGGGRAILTGWDAGALGSLAPVFGVTLGATHDALTFQRWDSHPLFASPNVVPATMAPAGDDWGDNGFYLTASAGSAAAGFTPAPTAGQAAIVVGNGGLTIWNGFLFDDYFPADADTDGENDIVELVENQMVAVLGATGQPMSGIPALGTTGLAVFALAMAGLGVALLGRRFLA